MNHTNCFTSQLAILHARTKKGQDKNPALPRLYFKKRLFAQNLHQAAVQVVLGADDPGFACFNQLFDDRRLGFQ